MGVKEDALGIAEALADHEAQIAELGDPDLTTSAEALHAKLRAGLKAHGATLGLSDDDIAEIDNAGPQRRGGEPKK